MSSSPSSSSAAAAAAAAAATSATLSGGGNSDQPRTFWCYECEATVAPLPSSPPSLLCLHCRGPFLEETPTPQTLTPNSGPSDPDPDPDSDSDSEPDSDSDASLSSAGPDGDGDPPPSAASPAFQPAIEPLPTVVVSDPSLACAVCKEDFAATGDGGGSDEAKKLPCGHVYHSGCIGPWLSRRNTCPLCRSVLSSSAPAAARGRQEAMAGLSRGSGIDRFTSTQEMAVILRNYAREQLFHMLRENRDAFLLPSEEEGRANAGEEAAEGNE